MKSILIASIIASSTMANTAYAQSAEPEYPWLNAGPIVSGNTTVYLNVETIEDLGDGIKQAWILTNYAKPTPFTNTISILSQKSLNKFNCTNESSTLIESIGYNEINGDGEVAFSDIFNFEWVAIVPGSIGEAVWTSICNR